MARRVRAAATVVAAALAAGCASRAPLRDGAPPSPPPGLAQRPDAEPRVEALRPGGPNKPYDVLGASYVPVLADRALRERGLASWYGVRFHGLPTASGEPYDMYAMTAAHKTMPIPSYARVRNPANGREVVVRINDRGPFAAGRVIDLSYTAALKLGLLGGVAVVDVERLTNDDIRAGLWRRERGAPMPKPPALPVADDPLLALVAAAERRGAADPAAGGWWRQRGAVAGPDVPGVVSAPAGGGWWLQLAAFDRRDGRRDGAERLLARARRAAPGAVIVDDGVTQRVHAGPYASRDAALAAAERLRLLLLLTPLLIEPPAP